MVEQFGGGSIVPSLQSIAECLIKNCQKFRFVQYENSGANGNSALSTSGELSINGFTEVIDSVNCSKCHRAFMASHQM